MGEAPKTLQDLAIYLDAAVCVSPGWEHLSAKPVLGNDCKNQAEQQAIKNRDSVLHPIFLCIQNLLKS